MASKERGRKNALPIKKGSGTYSSLEKTNGREGGREWLGASSTFSLVAAGRGAREKEKKTGRAGLFFSTGFKKRGGETRQKDHWSSTF